MYDILLVISEYLDKTGLTGERKANILQHFERAIRENGPAIDLPHYISELRTVLTGSFTAFDDLEVRFPICFNMTSAMLAEHIQPTVVRRSMHPKAMQRSARKAVTRLFFSTSVPERG